MRGGGRRRMDSIGLAPVQLWGAGRSSSAWPEQLPCKELAGGSNPPFGFEIVGLTTKQREQEQAIDQAYSPLVL